MIPKSERKIAAFSSLLNFLNGMLQSFLGAVPLALFIAQYDVALLPLIYVFAGLFVFATGIIIIYSRKIFAFFQFFTITTILLSCSLIILWIFFLFFDRPLLSIIFIIWGGVVAAFSSALISIIMNQLFTLQQAKRLFPLVQGAASSLGAMLVGFSLPLLAKILHLRNVPLVLAILLIATLVNVFIIRKYSVERFVDIPDHKEKKESFFSFHNRTYIIFLFIFVFITNGDETTFSVLFSKAAKEQFKDAASLAGFFGVLGAFCNILQSTIGLLTFRAILKKWGLFVALITIPVVVSILLGITFISDFFSSGLIFFGFLTATRVVQTVLRNGFLGSSFLLLFQPLKPNERLWAQLQNRFTISPLSVSLIGLILMGVRKFFGINFVALSLCMFGIYFVTILTLTFVKKRYNSVLMNAITQHFFVNADFTDLDAESLEIVNKKLKSPVPEEAIYALQTLENASGSDFRKAIVEALDHESDDVKIYALSKIRQYKLQNAEEKTKEIIKSGKSKAVIPHALLAIACLQSTSDLSLIKSYIYDSDRQISASSLIALYLYGNEEDKKECDERLNSSDGMLKALVLKEIDIPKKGDMLILLLKSEDRNIRAEACKAATIQDERLYPLLIENLLIPHVRPSSIAALISLKTPLFDDNFSTKYSYDIQIERLKIIGFLPDEKSYSLLIDFMFHKDKKLSHEAIRSLNRLSFQARDVDQKKQIQDLIFQEKNQIDLLQKNIPNAPLLKELVQREIELTQERLFWLLSFIYPKDMIMKALEGIQTQSPDMVSFSIEILLQTLNSKEADELLDCLTFDPYGPLDKAFKENDLIYIWEQHENFVISKILSALIFTIGNLKLTSLKERVIKTEPKDSLLQETKEWTLSRI